MTSSVRKGETYKETLLLIIKERVPWLKEGKAIIRQDGATPHTSRDTENKLNEAGEERSWKIKLVTQPAQPPDLSINDLGFFAFLKSLVWRRGYSTINDLVESVNVTFKAYDAETLERCNRAFSRGTTRYFKPLGGMILT